MALYDLAGLLVEMSPRYPTLLTQAEPYRSERDGKAQITITPPQDYVAQMQENDPGLSEDQCEYLAFGSLFYRQLLRFGGMMLHSSAVVADGRAYLFTAPPGTGKSTHTALWLQKFGERAYILNDDKPALRFADGKLYAYGTPFSGKTDLSRNTCAPVAGICILERGTVDCIAPISAEQALPLLYEQTVRILPRTGAELMLDILVRTAQAAPLFRMQCTPTPTAVLIAYQAMCPKDKEKR